MISLKKGFTLIELLIVITIIGILTAIVSTNLQGARSRARDVRRKSDLRAVEQSLRLYYNDLKQFPASDSNYRIVGCNLIACPWGSPFISGSSTYIASLPTDPSSSSVTSVPYFYYSGNDDQFLLVTNLENLSDSDIADSQARCADVYGDYPDTEPTTNYVVCAQ